MPQSLLAISALFLQGTNAGIHLGSTMMEHAARRLPADHWLAYTKAKGRVYGPWMPFIFGGTLVISIAALLILGLRPGLVGAAAALLVAGVITKVINLPLNARFDAWQPTHLPGDWDALRTKWQNWTVVRTALALIAFAATILAFSA
jgi:uncharacterized membrane protein